MRRHTFLIASAPILLTGCATLHGSKPYLTDRAFRHAAKACDVVPKGVHRSRENKIPYADYTLPGGPGRWEHDDGSHACLKRALTNYRYDFFGEDMAPVESQPAKP